jgi:uncharacterized membrane protein
MLEGDPHVPEDDVYPNLTVPSPPHDPNAAAWSLESLIGSRVLLGAGLISLLAGAAFFVKLTNDHHLIAPELRVLMGLVAGLALMLGGTWFLGKARTLVAEGVTGLGASVMYISLWGAYGPFHLIDAKMAFAAMVAVSGTLALIAWSRKSENVAIFGVIGGGLTPALLVSGGFDRITLAAYLAVLFGAMLVLAVRCRYRRLEAASFVSVLFYAMEFAPSDVVGGPHWTSTQSIIVASIFFTQFAGALFFAARRDAKLDRFRIAMLVGEVLAYTAVLELELNWNPHTLAIADAAFAAVLLAAVATSVPKLMRLTYAALGLAVLTRAVEAWGGGHGLTAMLAAEGAALFFIGVRGGDLRLRTFGYVMLALGACGAAVSLSTDIETIAVFNMRTFTAATVVLALAAMLRDFATYGPSLDANERNGIQPIALFTASMLAVYALSADVISVTALNGEWTAATQTGLSALWSIAATLLVTGGFRYGSPFARYLGIVLFVVTIAKVFTTDLIGLDVVARVISAMVLGAVLVAVAAGYQIAMLRGKRAS